MTIEDIKIRQLTNQYLIIKGEKQKVIHDLCGFQSQFMVNAIHSMKIRCLDFSQETVSEGLVKNWTIRGTVHIFAEDDLPLFKHCDNGNSYLLDNWFGYVKWNGINSWALSPERQKYF